MKEARKNTCDNNLQKVYQIPPVLQQMLKMLPHWPNALRKIAEDGVYSLQFLPGNLRSE